MSLQTNARWFTPRSSNSLFFRCVTGLSLLRLNDDIVLLLPFFGWEQVTLSAATAAATSVQPQHPEKQGLEAQGAQGELHYRPGPCQRRSEFHIHLDRQPRRIQERQHQSRRPVHRRERKSAALPKCESVV